MNRREAVRGMGLAVLAGPVRQVLAQAYPSRPIRVLIPVAAGGSSDVLMRLLFERMGLPAVFDNRPGAGGALSAEAAIKAAPDGYTLLAGTSSNLVLLPLVSRNVTYSPLRDFTPIAHLVRADQVVVVRESLPVRNLQELVALARSAPGKLSYGTGGIGSAHHLAAELLCQLAGISMVHVPYKGSTAAEADFVAGRLDVMFNNVLPALPSIQAGRARAVVVASDRRAVELPDTPTGAEAGYPDFEVYGWVGLFGPRDMPRPIVERLAADLRRVMALPEIAERISRMGLNPAFIGPDETAAHVRKEMEGWRTLISRRNLR
ncbi:MAG TPA: tripartite tricarboxylate transporter substrate binding protein, partial [Ramlibacter sp.]|nr:tripartite tricarboxylate transporter substrate binding protein [Ramlibacter sp.]